MTYQAEGYGNQGCAAPEYAPEYAQGAEGTRPGRAAGERIAYYGWNSNGIFLVNATLEWKDGYWKDVVFFEMREGVGRGNQRTYSRESGIRMLGDATDLRALAHAIRGLVAHRQSTFKKFTDPSRAKATTGGGRQKMLTLGCQEGRFYINMSQERKISVSYDAFTMLSMADQIERIASRLEDALYSKQHSA